MMSSGSFEPLMTTKAASIPIARARRMIVWPSMPGMRRSTMITAGRSSAASFSAAAPSVAVDVVYPNLDSVFWTTLRTISSSSTTRMV